MAKEAEPVARGTPPCAAAGSASGHSPVAED